MSDAVTTKPAKTAAPSAQGTLEKYAGSLWKDPAKWLLERGWVPEGDPYLPNCMWLDPLAPAEDVEEEVLVFTTVHEKQGDKYVPRRVPVMIKDDRGKPVQVKQKKITPRQSPIPRGEAIRAQQSREKKAQGA